MHLSAHRWDEAANVGDQLKGGTQCFALYRLCALSMGSMSGGGVALSGHPASGTPMTRPDAMSDVSNRYTDIWTDPATLDRGRVNVLAVLGGEETGKILQGHSPRRAHGPSMFSRTWSARPRSPTALILLAIFIAG